MVEGKWFVQGSDLAVPLSIRQSVFGTGRDALDDAAQQVVVYQDGTPVGAARLWWQAGDFCAGDVGVLPAQRGKGYGDLLVRLLLYKAANHYAASLMVRCPAACVAFFSHYGFTEESREGDCVTLRAPLSQGCADCTQCGGCHRD